MYVSVLLSGVSTTTVAGSGLFLTADTREHEHVAVIVRQTLRCYASTGHKPSRIAGNKTAVQYVHVVEEEVHLSMKAPLLRPQFQLL